MLFLPPAADAGDAAEAADVGSAAGMRDPEAASAASGADICALFNGLWAQCSRADGCGTFRTSQRAQYPLIKE